MVSMPRCGCHGKPARYSSGRSLRKSSSSRNGSNSRVSPKPKARRNLTPAPSIVGLDWTIALTGRIDIGDSFTRGRSRLRRGYGVNLRSSGNRCLFARCLERTRPPGELVEHIGRVRPQIGKLRDVLSAFPNRHEVGALNMDTGPDPRHLQLYCNEPQLFDRPSRTDRAVTDEGSGLFVPFRVGIVERILQDGRNAAIVFRADKNVAVELGDFLLPALRDLVLGRGPGIGGHFVEEGHRVFAQIDDLHDHVTALRGDVRNPLRGFMSETGGACGADDHRDLDLCHGGPTLVMV